MIYARVYCIIFTFLLSFNLSLAQRKDILLSDNWQSIANDTNQQAYQGFEQKNFATNHWKNVAIPHTWDTYEGYRRLSHGNRHGYAWYRKTFRYADAKGNQRFFLRFEGVGSYATVWLNGKQVGYHAGGRTSFEIDITDVLLDKNRANLLAVRADHPTNIQDLPWVCGGCSTERGFSEGSQPMGIFRPVHLLVTNELRLAPYGVHLWNDTTVTTQQAHVFVESTLQNYTAQRRTIQLIYELKDAQQHLVQRLSKIINLDAHSQQTLRQDTIVVQNPKLWSLENPYLYNLYTSILDNGKIIDKQITSYGIRWISWPIGKQGTKQFLLNGKPVFINGIAEYEHLLGTSHAFDEAQIKTRVAMVKAAGFNAFRDAHQPHNLRYQTYWDKEGILWWPQMAAHIWYDTPAFRTHFKQLLKDWVIERHNSPSIVLWGLENESTLPEDFAKECSDLIRQLDPTASSQRKITTCNGGKGTDWDVPQNWTGTYGGDPQQYGDDLERQVLVGEYGAWRSLDAHQMPQKAVPSNVFTEESMTNLMELKVKLAEAHKKNTTGHFFWLLNSHDNPGRVQNGEASRELERLGPVNYKGLFTPWDEPLDVFYMFRANYASPLISPMVYIASHTWPNRLTKASANASVTVYANCDEVELFNDINHLSLGRKKRAGIGTHFTWDNVAIRYNVLYAVGYWQGKKVAEDYVSLPLLPNAPHEQAIEYPTNTKQKHEPKATKGLKYLYRVNCGGEQYTDHEGNIWLADQAKTATNTWGSRSWSQHFTGVNPFFVSQRRTFDPIKGTTDDALFQTFRFGRDQLQYEFELPNGSYQVELYFIEPWYGTGGGLDCTGWRLFDVAINAKTVFKNIDIWKEVGHDVLLKKVVTVSVTDGKMCIQFPRIASGQALISAIAIAPKGNAQADAPAVKSSYPFTTHQVYPIQSWIDIGKKLIGTNETICQLPPSLFGTYFLPRKPTLIDTLRAEAAIDVYFCTDSLLNINNLGKNIDDINAWLETTKQRYKVYKKTLTKGEKLPLPTGNYYVMVAWASGLTPPFDLKASQVYKATEASFEGEGIGIVPLMGKDRLGITAQGKQGITWKIKTGVADIYALTLKYHNASTHDQTLLLTLSLQDGTLIKQEKITLNPSKSGKWSYFSTTSGTMINAGTYSVHLQITSEKDLYFDNLEIQ